MFFKCRFKLRKRKKTYRYNILRTCIGTARSKIFKNTTSIFTPKLYCLGVVRLVLTQIAIRKEILFLLSGGSKNLWLYV
nr:MAG TPA: hypothetical protein [Caudoviricetes sp.]